MTRQSRLVLRVEQAAEEGNADDWSKWLCEKNRSEIDRFFGLSARAERAGCWCRHQHQGNLLARTISMQEVLPP